MDPPEFEPPTPPGALPLAANHPREQKLDPLSTVRPRLDRIYRRARLHRTARDRAVSGDQNTPLDGGAIRARPDPSGLGSSAEQQIQPADDHGLARAGLTSDYGETRRQLQYGILDDPEAADAHLLQHTRQISGTAGQRALAYPLPPLTSDQMV